MLSKDQSYIVDKVENLLIELACDHYLTADELNEKTHEVIKLIHTEESKNDLIHKIEIRNEQCKDDQAYHLMIKQILNQ